MEPRDVMSDDEFYYLEQRKKQLEAAQKYSGKDTDRDHLDDFAEVQSGIHDYENVPQHNVMRRLGPSTPGKAFVGRSTSGSSGIIIPWSHDIIKISPGTSGSNVNGVHTMRTPKKMQLQVNFGTRHETVTGNKPFSVDIKNVSPHKHKIDTNKIKNLKISSVMGNINDAGSKHQKKMEVFSKKYSAEHGMKKESSKDHKTINALNERLTGFMVKKKRSGTTLTGNNLDFSVVGIVPAAKKKRGLLL